MEKELEEKDFIQESKVKGGWRIWLGLGAAAACFCISVFAAALAASFTGAKVEREPFLRVTNREFSLFLWQNPEFMRANRKKKSGYLSGFYLHPKATPIPEQADGWVSAPPDLLFLYHAWERLLSRERFERAVSALEFREFLDDAKEWQPRFWAGGGDDYCALVERLPQLSEEEIQQRLPDAVLRAFVGWKNYFREGKIINARVYTVEEIETFLEGHPCYAANYWRHLYPSYLRSLGIFGDGGARVPDDEIPAFLKAALYNSLGEAS